MQIHGQARERCKTIKSYLSGVRHLHIEERWLDPFAQSLDKLHYTIRGVMRLEGERGTRGRERLPITPNLLWQIKAIWDRCPPGYAK